MKSIESDGFVAEVYDGLGIGTVCLKFKKWNFSCTFGKVVVVVNVVDVNSEWRFEFFHRSLLFF